MSGIAQKHGSLPGVHTTTACHGVLVNGEDAVQIEALFHVKVVAFEKTVLLGVGGWTGIAT